MRQARGMGKPGSGKRKATDDISASNTTAPQHAGIGGDDFDNKDDDSGSDDDVPDDAGEADSDRADETSRS